MPEDEDCEFRTKALRVRTEKCVGTAGRYEEEGSCRRAAAAQTVVGTCWCMPAFMRLYEGRGEFCLKRHHSNDGGFKLTV